MTLQELEQAWLKGNYAEKMRIQKILQEGACQMCKAYAGQMAPSHFGSTYCKSGGLRAGGNRSHCACNWCF